MKKLSSKLSLKTMTLMPLQRQELDQINGGVTPVTPATPPVATASIRFCERVGNALLQSAQRSCAVVCNPGKVVDQVGRTFSLRC